MSGINGSADGKCHLPGGQGFSANNDLAGTGIQDLQGTRHVCGARVHNEPHAALLGQAGDQCLVVAVPLDRIQVGDVEF